MRRAPKPQLARARQPAIVHSEAMAFFFRKRPAESGGAGKKRPARRAEIGGRMGRYATTLRVSVYFPFKPVASGIDKTLQANAAHNIGKWPTRDNGNRHMRGTSREETPCPRRK